MFGSRILERGMSGPDIEELQIRLAGFHGAIPDASFGPGTELQVHQFQTDFMGIAPSGIVDKATFQALDRFAASFPIDFGSLKCKCGTCQGFGQGLYKGQYESGKPQIEAYHQYEYPGIHRVILFAARALWFYHPQWKFTLTSGYRCSVDNLQHSRSSTNHRGKALDTDHLVAAEHKEEDMARCDGIRGKMVEMGGFQIGWSAANRKSFEPSEIAPTWVHMDVRQFENKYLEDRFFCKSLAELDNTQPIQV
jgi:hypothetical protein